MERSKILLIYAGLVAGMLILLAIQIHLAPGTSRVGSKDHFIDVYCIGHLLVGIDLAGFWHNVTRETFARRWKTSRWLALCVACICTWEGVEFPAEIGAFGTAIEHWMNGVEPWQNRFLIDPACALTGVFLCRRFRHIYEPSMLLSVLYVGVCISAPTAMTVQDWVVAWVDKIL